MKLKRLTQTLGIFSWGLAGILLAGCSSVSYEDPNPPKPYVFPSQRRSAPNDAASAAVAAPLPTTPTPVADVASQSPVEVQPPAPDPAAPVVAPAGGTAPANAVSADPGSVRMQRGDLITVTFSDTPTPIVEHKERIRDDGKMTLIYNVSVQAAGRTAGELQEAIRAALVPKYFKYLTVIVKAEDRFYFVGGEVKIPNRQLYLGDMTVLRAIDTAGGFTDFANRKRIELRRSGKTFKIDWYKAMKNSNLDLPVYPNDQIIVFKRIF